MKIALVQLNMEWESKELNFSRAEAFVKKASGEGSDVVVFPEMFNSGFSMNTSAIAEEENGVTARRLSGMAKDHNINVIAGYAVKDSDDKKGRNNAVAYNRQGELIATYTKIHPFSFADENRHYDPGNNTVAFQMEGMSSSIFICYDLRFPEIFRSVAQEVQAIFIIANWPSIRRDHWNTLLKARAIENQCYIIGVNRTGKDGNGISYPGDSHIFGPSGEDVCSGSETEEYLTANINVHEVNKIRSQFPFLKDRRPFNIILD